MLEWKLHECFYKQPINNMKSIIPAIFLLISVGAISSCKTKKIPAASTSSSSNTVASTVVNESTVTNTTASNESQGASAGKVSHKYRATGCQTVIIISAHDDIGEITLIPKDKLNSDIDVDGQNITFDYRPLKMPQPAGCSVGMPAEISNITKLK